MALILFGVIYNDVHHTIAPVEGPIDPSHWAVPPFAGCSAEDLALVAKAADEYRARPGEVLVREGRGWGELFLVADGVAEVSTAGEVVGTLGRGQAFGDLATGDGRRVTVTALSPMRLWVLGPRELAGLVTKIGPLRRHLLGRHRS